jgi:hypothetical protein
LLCSSSNSLSHSAAAGLGERGALGLLAFGGRDRPVVAAVVAGGEGVSAPGCRREEGDGADAADEELAGKCLLGHGTEARQPR